MSHPHPATAAAGDRLDHDRVANALSGSQSVLFVFHHPFGSRWSWHAGFLRQSAAYGLILKRVHRPGTGADKTDVAILAHVGEVRVFREEAVSGMNGIHVRDLGRADDSIDAKVAFAAGAFANANCLISELHVHGVGVGFGVDRHRADVQLLAGANDPHGDFTTV